MKTAYPRFWRFSSCPGLTSLPALSQSKSTVRHKLIQTIVMSPFGLVYHTINFTKAFRLVPTSLQQYKNVRGAAISQLDNYWTSVFHRVLKRSKLWPLDYVSSVVALPLPVYSLRMLTYAGWCFLLICERCSSSPGWQGCVVTLGISPSLLLE